MAEIRQTRPEEIHEALALTLKLPGSSPVQTRAQVLAFLKYVEDRPMPPDAQYAAVVNGELATAGFRLDSPGKTALLFVPSMQAFTHPIDTVVSVIDYLVEAGLQRGMSLFQVLAPPDSPRDAHLLTQAGFRLIAELIYLERPATLPTSTSTDPSGITWIGYDQSTHKLFAETIEASYEDSLDCPDLLGLRQMEDIIAGHKDAGEFDPERWFIICHDDRPAGCLLLSRVRNRSALELVYMGLRPAARGKGLAKTMLRRAIQVTVNARLAYITLAVDARNDPARTLYDSFSFSETIRRSAWIRTPSCT